MNQRNRNLYIVFTLSLIVNIVILYLEGLRPNLYDAKGYREGADYLISHGRFQDFHHFFYGLHISIIALGRLILPSQIIQIVLFQILLSSIAVVALYKSAYKLFLNNWAALSSCLCFIFWFDCLHWNTTLMTESLFCSLTIFIIYTLVHFTGHKQDYLKLIILLLLLSFTRPTTVVIWVGVALFLFAYYQNDIKQFTIAHKFMLYSFFIILGLLGATLMFEKWDFTDDYIEGNIVTYMNTISGSNLYQADLHTPFEKIDELKKDDNLGIINMAGFIINHPVYFFTLAIKKIYYLITFQRPYYSAWHNWFNIGWLALVYSCFVIGFRACSNILFKAFVMTVIIVNCGLIGISAADWDNRFFIPMEPGIVLFAGYGIYILFQKMKSISANYKPIL